jgi:formiminotetrahydrofolate cyclodeaminase
VRINLPDLEDADLKRRVAAESDALVARSQQKLAEILSALDERG